MALVNICARFNFKRYQTFLDACHMIQGGPLGKYAGDGWRYDFKKSGNAFEINLYLTNKENELLESWYNETVDVLAQME